MSKYIISTDINADLPKDYLDKHNIAIVSLFYGVDDVFYDGGSGVR